MLILKRFVTDLLKLFCRSSSPGFSERFAGRACPDPAQAEDFNSVHVVDSASCFLDINSDGDVVTRALEELDLSESVQLLSTGGYNNDSNYSRISCDTAELLQTPFPYVAEPDHEPEMPPPSVEVQDFSAQEQDNWAALSAIHKAKSQESSVQVNSASQSLADMPATSTPKKQQGKGRIPSSNTMQILEGRVEGSGYHRDGTRVGQ